MNQAAQSQVKPNYGPYGSEQEALDVLVSKLVDALDPQMICLFGSRARGDARPDSDFDLLVVAKAGGSFGSDEYEKVYASVMGPGIGADYEEALELNTSFVTRIVDEGRLVYRALTTSNLGAAPHPPFGHLLPVKARGEGDNHEGARSPSLRHLRGEGGPKGRMRGSAECESFH